MENPDLLIESYKYYLPEELIAQRPVDSSDNERRDQSRLMVYRRSTNEVIHDQFCHIGNYLPPESLIVFNRSKVFPSRIKCTKKSGGKAEIFLLEMVPDENNEYSALIKTRSKKRIGDIFLLPDSKEAIIKKIMEDGTFKIHFNESIDELYLEKNAHIPIPPYIRKGESDELDRKNYQTVYAKEVGSVAAPTAGLHFTNNLLTALRQKKIDTAFVTLHVGIGTFRPVQTKSLLDHSMHFENFTIEKSEMEKIDAAKNVIAVGTTSLRVLESRKRFPVLPDKTYSTNIFLHPGVEVKSIKGLVTNFHLPESTLLVLVSALIGREKALELYALAVKERYRFFSYGDAMLILL